jgi:hypothetical protein
VKFNAHEHSASIETRIADAQRVGAKAIAVWIHELDEMRAEIARLREIIENVRTTGAS